MDKFELAEASIARLIEVLHKNELTYWEILKMFSVAVQTLIMQADAEWWVKRQD